LISEPAVVVLSRLQWLKTGFESVIGFTKFLQLITTSKSYALTVLHTSQITVGHTRSSQSIRVFTSHCLVAASNSGRSPSSGFPNCSRSQLPASHSNSSQRLNPSDYLTCSNRVRIRESESQSHFAAGGLPPISSSWRQAPWGSRQEILFQLNPYGHSPYVAPPLTRGWVCLLRICLAFVKCTYIACYWKMFLLHYIQVLCQHRPASWSCLYHLRTDHVENTASIIAVLSCFRRNMRISGAVT
jgi:hypothetical protein